MTDHPNVEAARTSLEGLMKGDVETMAAGIADNAVWHVPGSNRFAGDFVGKPAILARLGQMAEAEVQFTVDEIHDIVGGDDHVVALVRLSVTGPSRSASTGAIWVMHVRDGMATEFWGMNENQSAVDAVLS